MADITDYITSAEAAAMLGISQSMFSKLTQKDREKYRTIKVGLSLLWHKEDIEQLKRERESEGK